MTQSERSRSDQWTADDFVGGHPVLDFVNTVSNWIDGEKDKIDSFATWLDWCREAGQLSKAEADRLARLAAADERTAEASLRRVRTLRLALYRLSAWAAGEAALDESALAELRRWWEKDQRDRRLVPASDGQRLASICVGDNDDLDLPLRRLARAGVALLSDPVTERIKRCGGIRCGWLFLDTSKNKSRRWCDMATCGNSAKARRFRQAHRQQI